MTESKSEFNKLENKLHVWGTTETFFVIYTVVIICVQLCLSKSKSDNIVIFQTEYNVCVESHNLQLTKSSSIITH